MIQVCSQCGTRWNVRERRREWCPRCRGALLAPLPDTAGAAPGWNTPASPPARSITPQRTPPRLPPGFRWIAVRPGAAPPMRRGRRVLGPTPRYAVIPRWGLTDRVAQTAAGPEGSAPAGPPSALVRLVLFISVLTLGVAALVYVARYVLLVYNRKTLLNSIVATAADWLGDLASVAALIALITSGVLLIRWLIARRAAVFAHYGLADYRSVAALWAGCAVPLVNLLWAPVYVIELAALEDHLGRVRRPIVEWWIAWVVSYAVSIWAILTSFATDPQGIANNTVLMVFGYLFAAATLAAVARIFEGFERKPVARPAHRWVVVTPDLPARPGASDAVPVESDAAPVELKGEEPAA
ncbi:MAG: DUF4328 domain-containing protein [Actinomycetota bacterium]|uniref:DUF4328 domain-containing protein n=1 Tax=Mycobacterium lentiflavum TaxID=141349 RepID=A0ABY3URZ8_MYCLN|nr:DUF4328 domain-containing protein [Mycobacterium lentiflavum]MEE3063641.1 DUF4328 domain-containing protein [Actinomycetota bacterium]ULP42381.1 DUF4328 domain-containing protein [Mycobacterium lentiflavum]